MTKFVAHRALGKKNMQNTIKAFEYSSQSNLDAIEIDIRVTKDSEFVVFHDKNAARLCGNYKIIEKTDYKDVQKLRVFDNYNHRNKKVPIPTLLEFLKICKLGNKIAVIDLKSQLTILQIEKLIEIIEKENYLEKTIFISFKIETLKLIRKLLPKQKIQLLVIGFDADLLKILTMNKFDIDIYYKKLTREFVEQCKQLGIKVNCWTVNKLETAKKLQLWGVDYITTDTLLN